MPSTLELREGVNGLALIATADLDALWREVATAEQAREALQDVLPALVAAYGAGAATFAADWYDESRDEAGAHGRFRAVPADVGDTGAEVLARWGVGPLFAAEPDWAAARTLVAGGLQRRIADQARATVTGSSLLDPAAVGWRRVGDGDSCSFCSMLLGRGAVYTSQTVKFRSHDHCGCSAAPEWRR